MNIFYLDHNTTKCAQYHNDKHVVKMILETAQLLCGAHWATGGTAPYKPTHLNHPCAIWTRTNIENYKWLCDLGIKLCWEYNKRYLKTHKTYDIILWCCDNPPSLMNGKFFDPPMAMPDVCKIGNNVILSYRNYYMMEKRSFSKWKNGIIPEWF
jgi:hypothetical protein